jgi:hypothetical protein
VIDIAGMVLRFYLFVRTGIAPVIGFRSLRSEKDIIKGFEIL